MITVYHSTNSITWRHEWMTVTYWRHVLPQHELNHLENAKVLPQHELNRLEDILSQCYSMPQHELNRPGYIFDFLIHYLIGILQTV